ncbi:MAG: hypothetical protein Q4E36_01405 [Bacillota bacterium]|nr:hypothetical protein [Bacillota bacterium]
MKKFIIIILVLGLLVSCQSPTSNPKQDSNYSINEDILATEISFQDFKDEYREDFILEKTGFENKEIISTLNDDSKIYKEVCQRHYGDLVDVFLTAYFTDKDARQPFYVLTDFSDKTKLDFELRPGKLVFLDDKNSDYVYYNYNLANKNPAEDDDIRDKLIALGFMEDEKLKGYFYINEKLYLFEKEK